MTRKSRFVEIHKCICEECGHVMFVPRANSYFRKDNHKKHMYCPHCKERTLHIEHSDYDTRWHDENVG